MIKDIMKKKKVSSLPDLIGSAKAAGVKLVACNMTMELMGIRKEELIKGTEIAGVATYLEIGGGATLTCLSEIFLADAITT